MCMEDVELEHHAFQILELIADDSFSIQREECVRHLLDSRLAGVHNRPGLARVEGNKCLIPIWSTRNEWLS